MRKYIFAILVALIVGGVFGNLVLKQYHDYQGVRFTSNEGEMLYFIRYGIYENTEEMEKATLSLVNYIYNIVDDKYYVYIGITKDHDNLIKLNNYYSTKGYQTITEEFLVTNKNFLDVLVNYDNILKNTDDEIVISSISSSVLEKYEELVNGTED